MSLSVPRDQWSPEVRDLFDRCPRCGSDMGDDAHDDLDVWVCSDCCSCSKFSDATPARKASDGGGAPLSPERGTATTPANRNAPVAVAAAPGH